MVGDAEAALRCPACGKGWAARHASCPDDGSPLVTRTGTTDVRNGVAMLESTSTVSVLDALGGDTVIDPDHEAAGNEFDPFSSDVRTYLAHRPRFDEPSRSPGSKSSDPPTVLVRRSETHIELPPGSVVDEYEIDHRLGAGAMGEVYAARHVKLGKRVAIKVIAPRLSEDSAAVERFAQEARMLAQMHHPGLVDVLGFGELADGRAYFVMEYLSGTSLFDRLQRGRLGRDEALDIFGQMARALEAAHTHGVVHRDLKPENTFLVRVTNEQRPVVKLLDFGLARLLVDVDRRVERTQSGVVIGTAMYLSPEQARGPDVDGRTDVYALGCVGYELFLGQHPFRDARTVAALIAAHMHEAPPLPRSIDPSIPAALDLMLFAMLAKDPRHRPTLPQIRSVLEGGGPAAANARSAPTVGNATVPTRPRKQRTLTIAVVISMMAVGIVIGAASRGSRSEVDRPATSAVSDLDGGEPLISAPAIVPDAYVVDIAAAPLPAIDAGVPPQRVAGKTRHLPDVPEARDETHALDGAPVDAGVAPSPAPLTPTRGYLKILPPKGAQILVDGVVPVGSLSRLALASGRHRIQFSLGDSRDTFTVKIEAGATLTLDKRDLYRAGSGTVDRNRTVNPFKKKATPR